MATARDTTLPIRALREAFCFYSDDGSRVTWRERPRNHFLSSDRQRAFNSRWSGKPAFTSDNGKGYAATTITYRGERYRLLRSRVLFAVRNNRWPIGHVDHKDGNTRNDHPQNHRDVSNSKNMRNAKMWSSNTTGVTGVRWFKPRSCWTASIGIGGKSITLGYYPNKELAVAARRGAEKSLGYTDRHGRQPVDQSRGGM